MTAYNTDHTGRTANGTSFTSTIAASGNFSFIDVAAHDIAETIDDVVVCRVTMGDTALDPAETANGSWNANYASVTPGRLALLW
jgi:hypothetical protein